MSVSVDIAYHGQKPTAADTDLMSLPMRVRVSSTMGTAGALPPTSRSHDVYSRSPVRRGDRCVVQCHTGLQYPGDTLYVRPERARLLILTLVCKPSWAGACTRRQAFYS